MPGEEPFHYIKPVSAEEVFALWRESEMQIPRWIEHYKQAGFGSWDEWRRHSIHDLHFADLKWDLFRIDDPEIVVPRFFGGPFRAWISKYYGGPEMVRFSELIKNKDLQQSPIVRQMLENFPAKTYLIGFRTPGEGEIVIIEGMHRCCTLSLAALERRIIPSEVYIALANYPGPIPLLGQEQSPT